MVVAYAARHDRQDRSGVLDTGYQGLCAHAVAVADGGAGAAGLCGDGGDLLAELASLQGRLEGKLDIGSLVARAERLRDACAALSGADAQVNAALMAIGRALVPLDYTTGDRFDHDPALGLSAWPVLDPLRRLAEAEAGSDAARFAAVSAIRARNRLRDALDRALAAA